VASISGSSALNAPNRSSSNKIPPQLQTEGFQSVLTGLGINKSDIMSLSLLKGLQVDLNFQEVQLLEINQQQTEVLNALGIANAHLAIVLNDDNEIDRIKKKLKEIKEKSMDSDSMELLSDAFGINISDDSTVFTDTAGGVVIIKTGLYEIASVLNKEEEEPEESDEDESEKESNHDKKIKKVDPEN
jgi:hypothetical protein